MSQEPEHPFGDVNVTPTHPLKELFILLGGAAAIIVVLYILLGFSVNLIAERISPATEKKLASFFMPKWKSHRAEATLENRVQKIVDKLAEQLPSKSYNYRVEIVCTDDINALALPGGTIIIFSGLMEKMQSENALATVLGHEIGHFVHRDHLRRLGHGLVFMAMSVFLGVQSDSMVSDFVNRVTGMTARKFTQAQESAADRLGVELVVKTYGHAGGTTDLYETFSGLTKEGKFQAWFSTHPHPENRISETNALIKDQNWFADDEKLLPKIHLGKHCGTLSQKPKP